MPRTPITASYPEVAKDFHPTKNDPLRVKDVAAYGKRKVWWKCPEEHEAHVSPYTRVRVGCAECNKAHRKSNRTASKARAQTKGSIKEKARSLLVRWDFAKNSLDGLFPEDLTPASHVNVHWKCEVEHEYIRSPQREGKATFCPICYEENRAEILSKQTLRWRYDRDNTLADVFPHVAAEWNHDRNSRAPSDYTPKSGQMVWWRCPFGHEWQATITNRTHNQSGCPECRINASRMEIFIYSELKYFYPKTRLKMKIEDIEADVYVPELNVVIEIDGSYWHVRKEDWDRGKDNHFNDRDIWCFRMRQNELPFISELCVRWYGKNLLEETKPLFALMAEFLGEKKLENYYSQTEPINPNLYNELVARLPAPEYDDSLENLFPDLAEEWDAEENGFLKPSMFTPGSDQKVFWKCRNCGESWPATIKNRTLRKSGCPACAKKGHPERIRNARARRTITLAQKNPPCLIYFDIKKNGFPPTDIAAKSSFKAWWHCENGHSFQRSPIQMLKNDKCPVCNSLTIAYPEVAKQWDRERNGDKKPEHYSWGSGVKVWWRCSEGHSWETAIVQRTTGGCGCPECYNERRSDLYRELAARRKGSLSDHHPPYFSEWDHKKNTDLSPDSISLKSNKKVWWICPIHGSYLQALASKARGSMCPECAKHKSAESVRLRKLARSGSLADNHPNITKQWHPTKNGDLLPRAISSGSHRVVWWRCEKGHEWKQSPNARTNKRQRQGCPICRKLAK